MTFITPAGALTIPARSVRPHLRPVWMRTFATPRDVPVTPAWLRPRLADDFGIGPVTVAEYCIADAATYTARV